MKKLIICFYSLLMAIPSIMGQSFYQENFDSYANGDFLCAVSPKWTTWTGTAGNSEDVRITRDTFASDSQSIYFAPSKGNTPNVLLSFGGVHDTGTFRFSSKFFVPSGKFGMFNFLGSGGITALDFFIYPWGQYACNGRFGSVPIDQWFEVTIDADFDSGDWSLYIDTIYQGVVQGYVNEVEKLQMTPYSIDYNFYVDDVSYCVNSGCNPDISMNMLAIGSNPICSNRGMDVVLKLSNNGPQSSNGFILGLDMNGQTRVTYPVILNNLASGRDTLIILPKAFKTHLTGSNFQVKAVNVKHDRDTKNDVVSTTINVVPSPFGAKLLQGAPFQGIANMGTKKEPDLIRLGDTNTYELAPPAGMNNTDYGSGWNIGLVNVRTSNGILVPSSRYIVTLPKGSSNGSIAFIGSNTYLDSSITINITLTNSPYGCDTVVTRNLRVVPTPQPDFITPSVFCAGQPVLFENITTIHSGHATYMWYFGDNDSSDLINPLHIYTSPGTYTVRLVATSFPYGIVKEASMIVQVEEVPVTKFAVQNKCLGTAIDFQNQSTISAGSFTNKWDFGDGTGGTNASMSHNYTIPGIYRVRLITNSNGCKDTLYKNAYQFARPVAGFNVPSVPVCAKTEVNMKNTSTIALGNFGALWYFGDGTIVAMTDGKHPYTSAGTYTVKMIVNSEFGCKDSISRSVTIKPTPNPDFTTGMLCSMTPAVFTNKTVELLANPVYTWTFSDGYSTSAKHVTHSWPGAGQYNVMLKADFANGCSGFVGKNIYVSNQVKANFNVQNICSGETAEFINTSPGDNGSGQYKWDFGNGTGSSLRNPSNVYNTAAIYPVRLIALNGGACNDTLIKNLKVSENPVCDFTYTNLGSMNIRFEPSDNSYGKYEWFFGDGDTAGEVIPVHQYKQGNFFNVTMKATNAEGCSCELSKKISFSTGVNSINNLNVSIFPNPNNGIFTVQHSEGREMHVEIFSTLGVSVYNHITTDGSLTVNLGSHTNGIYLVKLTVDGLTVTKHVIMNR